MGRHVWPSTDMWVPLLAVRLLNAHPLHMLLRASVWRANLNARQKRRSSLDLPAGATSSPSSSLQVNQKHWAHSRSPYPVDLRADTRLVRLCLDVTWTTTAVATTTAPAITTTTARRLYSQTLKALKSSSSTADWCRNYEMVSKHLSAIMIAGLKTLLQQTARRVNGAVLWG